MGKIVITEELLAKARDYLPYAEKKLFLDWCAERCFDRLQITADGGAGIVAMPPMYKKNPFLVRRYMSFALVHLYLGVDVLTESGDEKLPTLDEFDRIGQSHIFNQLDRMKPRVKDASMKDKIFDLAADYRELEKMMNDEIYALLQVMNEPVTRLLASIQQTATPENLKNAGERLKEAQAEVEAFAAEKGGGGNG